MSSAKSELYEFKNFRLDVSERILWREGERVPLSEKAFDTLCALVRRGNHLVGKDELLAEVWADAIVEENNLDKNISILRKVLGERADKRKFIETVRGHGFRFVPEVRLILDLGFGIADVKAEEIVSEDEREKIENQITINDEQRLTDKIRNPKSKIQNRRWLITLSVLSIFAFISMGFYLWRENIRAISDAPIKSIAVLPFKPLVAENRDEVLEMGMADTLIARLGNNREIIVRPLSSVRKFGNLEQDALQAGRALAVDSVLDGNIQRVQDKIRVNVRLIKTADGSSLWTGTFDEKFTDIFVVQDAISRRVVAALELRLSGDEKARLEKRPTNNVEAYAFYLRGRFHAQKVTATDLRKAIEFYQKAIDADPNYALALAGMADIYRMLAIAAFAPSKEVCPQAKQLAERALKVDSSLAEAHIVLGWIGFLYDWDWKSAETELKKAIELAPNNSEAHRGYAHYLSIIGRHDEAIAEGKLSRELDPLTLITATLEGQFLFYGGRDAEAIEQLTKTLELDPNFWVAHNVLGRVYLRQERFEEAISELTKAKELSGGSTDPIMQLGYTLAKSGRHREAEVAISELKSLAVRNFAPAYNFAMIYNGLERREEALNYLEKSYQEREAQLAFIKIDTRWDILRSEPRFVELMRRMNFE